MNNISNHSMFKPSPRYIKFYKSDLTVVDGVKNVANFELNEVRIPYDLYTTSEGFLPALEKDSAINYGSLGTKVTFIMIKVVYEKNETNPINSGYPNPYLEYYFEDNADEIRTLENFMIFTTTKEKKFPKLLLNNPNSDFDAVIHILVATNERVLEENQFTTKSNFLTMENVSLQGIISHIKDKKIITIENIEGGKLGSLVVSQTVPVPINVIDGVDVIDGVATESIITSMERNGRIVSIITSTSRFNIMFIDEYNAIQGESLINYASRGNIITNTTGADSLAPLVTFTEIDTLNLNYHPSDNLEDPNDNIITKSELLKLVVLSTVDNRDGNIVLVEDNISIYDINNDIDVESIILESQYQISITINDIAGNEAIYIKTLMVITD